MKNVTKKDIQTVYANGGIKAVIRLANAAKLEHGEVTLGLQTNEVVAKKAELLKNRDKKSVYLHYYSRAITCKNGYKSNLVRVYKVSL